MFAFILLTASSQAACPSEVTIQGALTCSSTFYGTVDHEADSLLGGECASGECYTCGDPNANEEQVAPEAVYTFECQLEGTVKMLITDLPCDLDIYVLDDSCDPYTGCDYGSTAPYATDDTVEFTCTPGDDYYIVVEAYGTHHLDVASGPCTDDGTATGNVYSPTYTLSFDVSASTGCAEDCDDGIDNDLDGDVDCDDADCQIEDLCCDTDHDDAIAEDCGGDDCDDTDPTIRPDASEGRIADGIDQDCDGVADNGTSGYDDDGDGWTEDDGDCDDSDPTVHPGAEEIEDDGIDQDCDGHDAHADPEDPEDTAEGDDTGEATGDGDAHDNSGDDANGDDDGKSANCGCSSAQQGVAGLAWLTVLLPLALTRRRD